MDKIALRRRIAGAISSLVLTSLFITIPSTALADKGSDLQSQLGAAKAKIEQTKSQVEQGKAEQDNLVAQIMDVDRAISELTMKIRKLEDELFRKGVDKARTESQLSALEREIVRTENELRAAKVELSRNKKILNNRIKQVYKMGSAPFYAVLLNSSTFRNFVNRMNFVAMIAEQDTKLLRRVQAAEASVQAKRSELEREKKTALAKREAIVQSENQIKKLEAEQAAQLAAVQADKSQKQSLVDKLRQEQVAMLSAIQQEEANAGSISNQLNQWNAEMEAKARAEAQRAADSALSSRGSERSGNYGTDAESIKRAIEEESARQGINPGPVLEIVSRESGFDPYAVNPTSGAAGLFQRLPGDHIVLGDVAGQVQDGVTYIRLRYGTSEAALAWWDTFGWY